ncbi:uncharacterized protein LOC129749528 isoform X2 [Uranotaenia lowii]|uniref:uncharacterized protein LOC129749528 isoform X2 n=1 Tax=Uranotaenia lowii TaxID=190385 RepID=UPI002478958A|nr:uncharacterized protein LOC129749528 isoform X2 [Uranotaenia lowii]
MLIFSTMFLARIIHYASPEVALKLRPFRRALPLFEDDENISVTRTISTPRSRSVSRSPVSFQSGSRSRQSDTPREDNTPLNLDTKSECKVLSLVSKEENVLALRERDGSPKPERNAEDLKHPLTKPPRGSLKLEIVRQKSSTHLSYSVENGYEGGGREHLRGSESDYLYRPVHLPAANGTKTNPLELYSLPTSMPCIRYPQLIPPDYPLVPWDPRLMLRNYYSKDLGPLGDSSSPVSPSRQLPPKAFQLYQPAHTIENLNLLDQAAVASTH